MKLDSNLFKVLGEVISKVGEQMDTKTIDAKVKQWRDKYAEYKEADQIAKAKYGEAAILQGELLDMLEEAGKTKYFVEGMGTVYTQTTKTRSMPKDPEAKRAFLDYIKDKHGEDVFYNLVSIYSQSLNSYCKEEEASGNADFPGLSEPKTRTEVRFRKG